MMTMVAKKKEEAMAQRDMLQCPLHEGLLVKVSE
jgi:hypothetical protein